MTLEERVAALEKKVAALEETQRPRTVELDTERIAEVVRNHPFRPAGGCADGTVGVRG